MNWRRSQGKLSQRFDHFFGLFDLFGLLAFIGLLALLGLLDLLLAILDLQFYRLKCYGLRRLLPSDRDVIAASLTKLRQTGGSEVRKRMDANRRQDRFVRLRSLIVSVNSAN